MQPTAGASASAFLSESVSLLLLRYCPLLLMLVPASCDAADIRTASAAALSPTTIFFNYSILLLLRMSILV